jgi:hypothetical protein
MLLVMTPDEAVAPACERPIDLDGCGSGSASDLDPGIVSPRPSTPTRAAPVPSRLRRASGREALCPEASAELLREGRGDRAAARGRSAPSIRAPARPRIAIASRPLDRDLVASSSHEVHDCRPRVSALASRSTT